MYFLVGSLIKVFFSYNHPIIGMFFIHLYYTTPTPKVKDDLISQTALFILTYLLCEAKISSSKRISSDIVGFITSMTDFTEYFTSQVKYSSLRQYRQHEVFLVKIITFCNLRSKMKRLEIIIDFP